MVVHAAKQAQAYFAGGLLLAAREAMERWVDMARSDEPTQLCSALNGLGSVYIQLNLLPDALAAFTESTRLSGGGDTEDAVRSLSNLCLCQYLAGAAQESVASGETAYAKAQAIPALEPRVNLHVHLSLGLGYIACARWPEARRLHEQALEIARSLSDRLTQASVLNNLGLICVELGEYDAALTMLTAAYQLMEELGNTKLMAYTLTEFGRLYLKRGELAQALHYGSLALSALWENMGGIDKAEVARLCELFGSVAYATGDRQGAVSYLQRAVTYYGQQDRWREWEAATATLNAVVHRPIPLPQTRVAIDRRDQQLLRYFTALLGLMDTLEVLCPHLRGRAELVAKYATLLGAAIGLETEALQRLSHAARLHDVGLTAGEGAPGSDPPKGRRAGEHSLIGERLLQMFDAPLEVRQAVRHHRERYDGEGGPDGLAGEQIPLFARLIAVADEYVSAAMHCADPRVAHSRALEHVVAQSGTQLDPALVTAFVHMHESRVPRAAGRFSSVRGASA